MKSIVHIMLAAVISCAAVPAAAQVAGTRSIAKDVQAPPAKTEIPGSGVLSEPRIAVPKYEVQNECRANWTAKKYKSFGSVQSEIKKRYGEVRILRVALCGEGTAAYFQIIILSGHGLVSRIQIAASN